VRNDLSRGAAGNGELFDQFPFGLMVVDADGRLAAANPPAAELLAFDRSVDGAVRCCDVLLCRSPDGPLKGRCISELAREAGRPLPEVRIDVTPRGVEQAVWVTAAPLGAEESGRVLLHLRPGELRDRRRRTQPHWLRGPKLRINALGRTRVDSVEGPLDGTWLERRPGQILKFLVSRRGGVAHTDEIAEALWAEASPQVAGTVRHFVHALRDTLEPEREKRKPSSFVTFAAGGYSLNPEHVQVDVDEFELCVDEGLEAARGHQTDIARERLTRAAELYRGDFIADEPYADWALTPRELVRARAVAGFGALVEIHIAAGEAEDATALLARLAEMHPFDAHMHRPLLELLLKRGRRSEAMRRYGALRARLQRDFGETPGFSLADL
jgi:DNA-binding SARP family transcriptional activator